MPRTPQAGPQQLSLFDEAPSAPLDPRLSPGSRKIGPAAPAPGSPPPTAPAAQDLMRHPRAAREVVLRGQFVAYAFRRARRRSIGFTVGIEGLSVSAPRWASRADIDDALQEKSDWILKKLAEQRERAQRLAQARVEWRDGTSIPFLGESVIVVLDPRVAGAQLNTEAQALPGVARLTLHLGLPQGAEPGQIRDTVQSWLQRQARRVFDERCRHFAAQLGVQFRRLALSSASTRWGCANANGSIHLNWRLIHFALPVIDYVVAHELAHLREMNHSPAFWDVVRSVMPDFESARGALSDDLLPVLD